MKKGLRLNLRDLEFDSLTYKDSGAGLRKWLLASTEYFPKSFRGISESADIKYRTLLRFIHKKTQYMSYSNMSNLRIYIKSLTSLDDTNVEEKTVNIVLKKEDFFEG